MIVVMTELWKRVDPDERYAELDKIHEFIDGYRHRYFITMKVTDCYILTLHS